MGAQQNADKGWPHAIYDLEPSDFSHGSWMRVPDGTWALRDERRADAVTCGTRCCLVGWARVSFGLSAAPMDSDISNEAAEFLIKFLDFAGYEPAPWVGEFTHARRLYRLQTYASDCFEGDLGHTKLTPEKAASAWKKTREHFGYTEVS